MINNEFYNKLIIQVERKKRVRIQKKVNRIAFPQIFADSDS
ncbi:MAG: hypothetical protein RIS64_2077 [Bacteroidota bacterium]|jgi:hypothetical protein